MAFFHVHLEISHIGCRENQRPGAHGKGPSILSGKKPPGA